jgi:hypothetical protein
METIVKTDYKEAVLDVLKPLEGPLSVQPIVNVVVNNPQAGRIIMYAVGQDGDEEVYEKPVIISFTEDGKIRIEKNYTDVDLREKLLQKGVPYSDILLR